MRTHAGIFNNTCPGDQKKILRGGKEVSWRNGLVRGAVITRGRRRRNTGRCLWIHQTSTGWGWDEGQQSLDHPRAACPASGKVSEPAGEHGEHQAHSHLLSTLFKKLPFNYLLH